MTDLNAEAAAWQAAQSLRDVMMLLNATDTNADGSRYRGLSERLASSGPGTAWEAAETALRLVLTALLTADAPGGTTGDARARAVIEGLYESGESVAWTVGCLRREESDAAEYATEVAAAEAAEAAYADATEYVAPLWAERSGVQMLPDQS